MNKKEFNALVGKFHEMDLNELKEIDAVVGDLIDQKKRVAAVAMTDQVKALVEKSGFSFDELFGKGARPKAVAKYRNPANPAETYTGQGRKPNWLVKALEGGANIEDFAIKPSAPASSSAGGRAKASVAAE